MATEAMISKDNLVCIANCSENSGAACTGSNTYEADASHSEI